MLSALFCEEACPRIKLTRSSSLLCEYHFAPSLCYILLTSDTPVIRVAGSDTTSTSVQSILLSIVTNSQVYNTLRSEVREAVRKGQVSYPIKDAEAKQLVYLQSCILEGLRKFPPLSQLRERVVPPQGDTVGAFRLPGGTFVGLNTWGAQLNKAVYGNDADLYYPERWLTDDAHKLQKMYQTHSLIFGHGSTRCLGVSMAMMEITKVIFEVRLFFAVIFDLLSQSCPLSSWRGIASSFKSYLGIHTR